MPWTHDLAHPAAASVEDAYALLSFAIISQTVEDLRGTNPQRRASARLAVQEGTGLALWLDLLYLTPEQRYRVLALLDELMH